MSKGYKLSILLLFVVFLFSGCATSASKLRTLSVGMAKNDVVNNLGEPTVVRGSMVNKSGQTIEVWEYILAGEADYSPGKVISKTVLTVVTLGMAADEWARPEQQYWLFFHQNRLFQWGRPGDWANEPDRTVEIRNR